MSTCHVNSYYALVWNNSLERRMEVKGELITNHTTLPKDPRVLYGTNNNDVAKIRKVSAWEEIEYDTLTTKQTVRFWKEVDEYILSRDVRIIIWDGRDTLCLPNDKYKIVSPDLFEYIVQTSGKREIKDVHGERIEDENITVEKILESIGLDKIINHCESLEVKEAISKNNIIKGANIEVFDRTIAHQRLLSLQ